MAQEVPMPTRNVVLTSQQEALIAKLVKTGRYQNASEVLRDGLRMVQHREADYQAKLKVLRAEIDKGVRAVERGEYVEFDNPRDLKAHLKSIFDKAVARGRA
jgi:antitoxin ParD1/3/4